MATVFPDNLFIVELGVRFCSECFHRSLRMELGSNSNKECPLCRLRLASRRDSRPDEAFDTLVKMLSYSHHTPAPTTPTTPSATSPRGRGRASREADAEASGDCLPNFDLDQYRRTHLENIAKFKEKQVRNLTIPRILFSFRHLLCCRRSKSV